MSNPVDPLPTVDFSDLPPVPKTKEAKTALDKLKIEMRLLHLAIHHADIAKEVCEALSPEHLDAAHRPLLKAIAEQGRQSKWSRCLTREAYQQAIKGDKKNLIPKMNVYDKCDIKAHTNRDDYDSLIAKWNEEWTRFNIAAALREATQADDPEKMRQALAKLATTESITDGLTIIDLADVEEQEVEWLWASRLARGKLSLFLGDPESGKSFVSLNLAARISRGKSLPHSDETTQVGDVLLLSSEDGVADTIKPRFMAQGGDPEHIHVIQGRADGSLFSLDSDIPLLEKALAKYPDTRLIIIDPLNAYLGGKVDSHRDADVRRILSPLTDFADRTGIAVVGITHMGKDKNRAAIHRALGSIGFIAAARAAWVFVRDREDTDRVLFLQVKNNLAKDPGGLAFRIVDGVVQWENELVDTTANDALSSTAMPRKQAKEWLEEVLSDGPMKSKDIYELADKKGISARTLKRAKNELGVTARKAVSHWEWELPESGGEETSNEAKDETKDEIKDENSDWWE